MPRTRLKAEKGSPPDVAKAWARLEAWFAKKSQLSLGLRPGVKEKQLVAAEKALGVKLPEDFKASLRIHDGQEPGCDVTWLPFAQQLGSLDSLVSCWKDDRKYFDDKEMAQRLDWLDDGKRVRQVHLHPQHIPFAGSRYWDYGRLLLDFIPGPKGTTGQVIARDDIDFVFVSPSYGAFLEQVVKQLESGKFKVTKQG